MEQTITFSTLVEDVQCCIISDSSIQSLGRFGCVSKVYNDIYHKIMFCPVNAQACISKSCSFFATDSPKAFETCTKFLSFYAKRYHARKDEQENNEQAGQLLKEDRQRFEHLFQHHQSKRLATVKKVRGICHPTMKDCLETYAGNCSNDSLMKEANTIRLKTILEEKDSVDKGHLIETLLQDNYGFYIEKLLLSFVIYGDKDLLLKVINLNNDNNKNCNLSDLTIIRMAISHKKNELVCFLIDKCFEVYKNNKQNFHLFKLALENDCCVQEVVSLFADDINMVDEKGSSLLHHVIMHKIEYVKFLLEKGINVNAQDNCKKTALHILVQDFLSPLLSVEGHTVRLQDRCNKIQTLWQAGADLNIPDDDGNTLLLIALQKVPFFCSEGIVLSLLDKGVDTSVVNKKKSGIYHCFMTERSEESQFKSLLCKLIEKGGNVNAVDIDGNTPFDLAQKSGMYWTKKYLHYGIKPFRYLSIINKTWEVWYYLRDNCIDIFIIMGLSLIGSSSFFALLLLVINKFMTG